MKNIHYLSLAACAVSSHVALASETVRGLVAHEWGTFTSVQAHNGEPQAWRPFDSQTSELPGFVYNLTWPDGRNVGQRTFHGLKDAPTLQRMETPVIYFHSDAPRKVDVTVDFPQGRVTEWYPQDAELRRRARAEAGTNATPNRLHWSGVEILSPNETGQPPKDASGSHYFAARQAEANFVRVPVGSGKSETEKFLFYRGVGDFRAPLKFSVEPWSGRMNVENLGGESVAHLFLLEVQKGRARFAPLPALEVGAKWQSALGPEEGWSAPALTRGALASALKGVLVTEGLFESEAVAMVKTWEDAWFVEPGVRVLYLLPRAWTDRVLPLAINPQPEQVVRVMVGRAELILPEVELALLQEGLRHATGTAIDQEEAIANVSRLHLGRFFEPALARVARNAPPVPALERAWTVFRNTASTLTARSKDVAGR